ncbi:winged helix-turn-helix transcriptional regulator [Nonomuraea glycinis]|uniref:winged helix-turn-helix transcriptional regulator n=1 Tax=Nonomuraea glycinis TaxID=2047744 RepID=UPI00166C36EF|nr:winged helix-turn-helix transcriptional regulator [Nonomuraea glycinis]
MRPSHTASDWLFPSNGLTLSKCPLREPLDRRRSRTTATRPSAAAPAAPWRSSGSDGRPASCSRWPAAPAALVERTVIPTTPVSVRYHLTPRGVDLVAALQPIAGYVQRWNDDPGAPASST